MRQIVNQLGNLHFGPIDRALDRLRSQTTVQERLGVLQQLVEFWHGPIEPEDGVSDSELAGLPPWRVAVDGEQILCGARRVDVRDRELRIQRQERMSGVDQFPNRSLSSLPQALSG